MPPRFSLPARGHAVRRFALVCLAGALVLIASAQSTLESARRNYDVPGGDAEKSLKLFSVQSGRGVIFSTDGLKGLQTNAVAGSFTAREALDRMVADTGLVVGVEAKTGAFAVRRGPADPKGERAERATPPARPSSPPTAERESRPGDVGGEPVTLSPFTVNAEADTGYAANSTLAGSRFKTDLKDTAASISVLTADFLSDVGANNLEEALRYSTSAQLDISDAGSDGATPNGNSYQGGPASFRVRGQPTTQARNFFNLRIQTDNYNVERIEDSRGPNSVLFGFGAPGGILNISTKQPGLTRSFKQAAGQIGSFASHREAVDVNEVLQAGRLAVRLNAVYEQSNKFQEYAFNRDRRFDLAVKFQATPTLQFRAEYERGLIKENKARPFTMLDGGILRWHQVGAPTFPTAIATNTALSITRLGSARRVTYIGNTGQVIEAGTTLVTTDTNLAIRDRGVASPTINYGGPGQINSTAANDVSALVEKRLGRRTFVELGFNHQDQGVARYNPGQTNLKIWGDPNQILRTGQANPYVGQMFLETSSNDWERNTSYVRSDLFRGTISTEFDAGRWGDYRLAVLGEHDDRANVVVSQREVWAGRPFNTDPENAANQVRRRNYVTPGEWDTYFINSPLTTGLIRGAVDPITGRTLDSTWVTRSQSQQDDPAKQTSALVAGQARFLGGRLVVSGGSRYDKLNILDRTAQRDPVTNEWSIAYATEARVEREARNQSFGVVGHVTDQISLHYNRANNQGLGGSQRIIDIGNLNGPVLTAPNSEGQGQDYGVTLALWDGRIQLRAVRYTTEAKNLVDSFSPTGIGPDKVAATILGTLRTAGLVTQAVADARTPNSSGVVYDFESKGYEFNLTVNPTKNWRCQANYSYTDSHEADFGREIRAWMDSEIAFWRSFNRGNLITSGSTTIEQAIAFMLDGFNTEANLANIGERGLRKHKVNVFTRYDLPWERLKGAYVGAGYIHQSKPLAGTDSTNTLGFFGNSYWRADLMAGYKFPKAALKKVGRFVQGLTLQLNMANVFDDDDPLVTRIQPDGVTVLRAVVQAPRTWRLQAKVDF